MNVNKKSQETNQETTKPPLQSDIRELKTADELVEQNRAYATELLGDNIFNLADARARRLRARARIRRQFSR